MNIGLIVELVVAVLLVLTIAYCMQVNRRLKMLKADEHLLRATISELVTATDIAERAIAGLKLTVREGDAGLGERLRHAERIAVEFDRRLFAGRELLDKLSQIVGASRVHGEPAAPSAPPQDAQAIAAAADAFAERLRTKVFGLAA
jgi:hypothetical protein